MIRVLNLYAGIGGNRKLWEDVEVTAVEINPQIVKIYQDFFPNDKVIITDAHQYLLEHFKEFDFIWSSPPCPSHSKIRKNSNNKAKLGEIQHPPIYPDMKLYEEILFLDGYYKGMWVVENVISWYDPLIQPFICGHHYFWSNFYINDINIEKRFHQGTVKELEKRKGFILDDVHNLNKCTILKNCVEPEVGLHIFNCAFKIKQNTLC